MKRFRPNYFVGLRLPVVESPSFASTLSEITNEIVSRNNRIERILSRHEKLHLTLALVEIDETSMDKAISCFQSSDSMLQSLLADQNILSFSGVNAFGQPDRRNVLWLEPSGPERDYILRYSEYVSSQFTSLGMPSEASGVLHGTIANRYRKNIVINESDYRGLDHYFITPLSIQVFEVDLLKIGSRDPETGYYQSVSKLRIAT